MSIFNKEVIVYKEGQFLAPRDTTSLAICGKGMYFAVALKNEFEKSNKVTFIKVLAHENKEYIDSYFYVTTGDCIPYKDIVIGEDVTITVDDAEKKATVVRFIYDEGEDVKVEVQEKKSPYTKTIITMDEIKEKSKTELTFLPPLVADYVVSDEVKASITKDVQDLLEKFLYSWTYAGVDKIIGNYVANKLALISLLSKHPNWNPDKLQIRLEQKLTREIDVKEIGKFFKYFKENFKTDKLYLEELKVDEKGYDELSEELSTYLNLIELVSDFKDSIDLSELLGDLSYDALVTESEKIRKSLDKFAGNKYSKDSQKKQDTHYYFVDFLCKQKNAVIDAKMAEKINSMIPEMKANSGQKLGRIVNKFCKLYGYCDFEIEEDVRVPIVNPDGTVELDSEGHSVLQTVRKKVKPYEREFASLSDSLSPKDIIRPLIVSVHPIDYLSMSFGNSWTSCHSIDNNDVRKAKLSSSSGCNCLGTMSYMCDPSTVVMYTVSEKYEGTDYETQDKINRCLFHYGEGKLIQARVYPQSTDGDSKVYESFRIPVLELFSKCLGIDCTWETTTDNDLKNRYINTVGYHYTDYTSVNGSNISAPKQFKLNQNKFTIGSLSTCVTCGSTMQSNKKNKLSCCHEAGAENLQRFRKTHPLTGSDPKDEVCASCGKVIRAGQAVEINGKLYHESCTFFCYEHRTVEVKQMTDILVEYVGRVCAQGIEESGNYFKCDHCDRFFVNGRRNIVNGDELCSSCYDELDEELEFIDDDDEDISEVDDSELW